ncbi:WD repeat-containing protein 1 [Pteropus alecto]|uniref:WD repeat-containing protein 1 n=1 Tax=Pteropus alecto TaxID=9402 RepID=L5K6U0_PTEAL|nr:WD repeat-containing protein 1 [Pteropus alecto]
MGLTCSPARLCSSSVREGGSGATEGPRAAGTRRLGERQCRLQFALVSLTGTGTGIRAFTMCSVQTRGQEGSVHVPPCERTGSASSTHGPGWPLPASLFSHSDPAVLLQKKCFSIDSPGYEPEVVAVHPSGDMVAVGGTDGNVRLYSILGTTLKDEGKLLEAKGPVTDLAYSHDGAFLAVCDASKVVTVFSVADGYSENNVFYGHHAKIVCLAWSPDNEHFASGGMDMMVYVWTLSDPETRVKIQDAHRLHHVSSLAWLDEHTLVTTSHDASVKEWTITY